MHTPSFAAPVSTRLALVLCTGLALTLGTGAAHALDYSFTGTLSDGPLTGQSFSGNFSFNEAALSASFTGELPLTAFGLQLGAQLYTLTGADAGSTPGAAFDGGQFVGLSFSDSQAVDSASRPHVAFVAGFTAFDQAYLGYVGSGGAAGFGSYSVAVVPEPGTWALWLAGLVGVTHMARRKAA
jgi:hypothetical protein